MLYKFPTFSNIILLVLVPFSCAVKINTNKVMMFESSEGLNFYRRTLDLSSPIHLNMDLQENIESGTLTRSSTEGSSDSKKKVGMSSTSEHIYKESKIREVRDFLNTRDKTCCSRQLGDPCYGTLCFDVFKCCAEQEASIRNLRMKYFHPNVTKKSRREVLKRELLSMIEVCVTPSLAYCYVLYLLLVRRILRLKEKLCGFILTSIQCAGNIFFYI